MLAFIEEDVQSAKTLYQEAIKHLEHIKYYCVEAQYLFAKFLQLSDPSEFESIYKKGLLLSQKHHYRYLQFCFEKLLDPLKTTYNHNDYPLPNNEDYGEYIEFLIKKNQHRL